MTSTVAQIAGIDISKDALDVCLHPSGETCRVGNDAKGFRTLIAWCGARGAQRIVFEPTGAYHWRFERRFLDAGFTLFKANPRRVRRFADAIGVLAKTDAVDAAVIARFGALVDLAPLAPVDETLDLLKELAVARRALVKLKVAAGNREQIRRCPLLKKQAREQMRLIERQLADVEDALADVAAGDPALAERLAILRSIPGVGDTTALALLAAMPELGALHNAAAASLAGLAPVARESGRWQGRRCIAGGRFEVRQALYMPALVAIRFNAEFKAKHQALIAAGKPPKVAIVAIMRKLIILANVLLKDRRAWTPKNA